MYSRVNNLIYAAGEDLYNTIRTRIALTEPVDPDALRKAVDMAIVRYPYFSVKLERTGEEYVLVRNDAQLPLSSGGKAIALGGEESRRHLFAIVYDDNLIYFDTSHFLTDGNGIFPFIKTLLYCYLHIVHPEEEFDTSGIALPDSAVPADEADDYPFPAEIVPTDPIGFVRRPERILTLDDQPEGYSERDRWTSFRLKIKQKELIKFASSVDGSPASFIASVMYLALSEFFTDKNRPIVCGMQHQYRRALGKPNSHLCHVNIVPIIFTRKMHARGLDVLNTMARGTTLVRTDVANDLLIVNKHIKNEARIKDMPLAEKHDYMRAFVRHEIGRNTFEISYTGRVDFSGLDRYIADFTPIVDMSLSGGISVEIFALGDNFSINIMQRNKNTRYVDEFIRLLQEKGITCVADEPEGFEINDFVM